jgi:hypothetical protein
MLGIKMRSQWALVFTEPLSVLKSRASRRRKGGSV